MYTGGYMGKSKEWLQSLKDNYKYGDHNEGLSGTFKLKKNDKGTKNSVL